MKKTKVIIPALGILLLSTAASVTGTVAWFTTNNSVSASTMTIKAVVSGNLFIKEGNSATLDQINAVSATLSKEALALSPVDVVADGTTGAKLQIPDVYSTSPAVGDAGVVSTYKAVTGSSITPVGATNETGYVLVDYVSIANKQTNASTFPLHPTVEVEVNSDDLLAKALRAGIVIAQFDGSLGAATYYESGDAAISTKTVGEVTKTYATLDFNNGTNPYPSALNDNKIYRVALMLWFEGDDGDCFVNNAQHLGNCVASWTFSSAAA